MFIVICACAYDDLSLAKPTVVQLLVFIYYGTQ